MYHNFLLAPRFIYIKYGVAASFRAGGKCTSSTIEPAGHMCLTGTVRDGDAKPLHSNFIHCTTSPSDGTGQAGGDPARCPV